MRAAEELAKRQRERPLGPAGDRVRDLFQGLPVLADPEFEQVRTSANLSVGEINFRQPNAKTFHLPDGSHLITIFSGLIDFYAAACEILMNAGTFHTGKGESQGRTLEDLRSDMQELFLAWTPQGIREDLPSELKLSSFLQTERTLDARTLMNGALRFILCHELGHVLFYRSADDEEEAATGLTREQEMRSDSAGMRTAVSCDPDRGAVRMNFAGCVISLRILAVFGMLGHSFTGDHPDPLARVENVFAEMRSLAGPPAQYWRVSPIAYALDEELETVGQRIAGGPDVLPVRADRAFSRLCAALDEVVWRRQEPTIIVPLMAREFEEATDEQMRVIAGFGADMFSPRSYQRFMPEQTWAARGTVFRSLYHQWPTRSVAAFNDAFKAYTWPGARIDGDNWMS